MMAGLLTALLLFAQQRAPEPQALDDPAANKKCTLDGTAIASDSEEPLSKTTVWLASSSPEPSGHSYQAVTDTSGHFRFTGIPGGNYQLIAQRAGYVRSELGARQPGGRGTTLRLKADDQLSGVVIRLTRSSVMSGRILDEIGKPLSGATVSAVAQDWLDGKRGFDKSHSALTNDAGEYRIFDLPPGKYYLCADYSSTHFVEAQGGPEMSNVFTCYPHSHTLDGATQLSTQAGQNLPGLDLKLLLEAVFHIRGKLVNSSVVAGNTQMYIEAYPHGSKDLFDLEQEMQGDIFQLSGAAPGTYDIELIGEDHTQVLSKASVEVKKSDVNGVVLTVPPRPTLKGVIRSSDANGTTQCCGAISAVDLDSPWMSSPYFSKVAADGAFELTNLWPGKYVFSALGLAEGMYIKSIQYNGREVLGSPITPSSDAGRLEILIGKGAGQVSGQVSSSDQDTNLEGLQVVLSAEPPRLDPDGLFLAASNASGHFAFKQVPPGNYLAFAVDAAAELSRNRDFVAQLRTSGAEIDVPEAGDVQIQAPLISPDNVQRAIAAIQP